MRTGIRAADWFARTHDSAGAGKGRVAGESVEPELLTRADVFVIWEQNVDYVKCYM